VYENGGFASHLPFAELKQVSLIDAKAQAPTQAPDFSADPCCLPGFGSDRTAIWYGWRQFDVLKLLCGQLFFEMREEARSGASEIVNHSAERLYISRTKRSQTETKARRGRGLPQRALRGSRRQAAENNRKPENQRY